MSYYPPRPQRLDPKAPNAHDVVKDAARFGFTVSFCENRDGYLFRHRLGKVKFFVPQLHNVDYRDLQVWD